MHSKSLFITCLLLFIFYTNAQDVSYSGDTTIGIDTTFSDVTITTLLSTAMPTTTPTPCEPEQPLFNAGGIALDKEDDIYEYVCFPIDVPISSKKVECVYIYINGLISTIPTFSFEARKLSTSDEYTFAPFWSDIDIRNFGSVTYKQLEKYPESRYVSPEDEDLLGKITTFIQLKEQYDTFDAVYALIVTWTDVIPHLATTEEKGLTFQFILVTNGLFTYAVYIYDSCSKMSWDFQFPVNMGLAAGGVTLYNNIYSLTDQIISSSLLTGNNGAATWVFLVSTDSPENYKLKCLKWHWDNKDVSLSNSDTMRQCACTKDVMATDNFFTFWQPSNCYQQIMSFYDQGRTCCYDTAGSLTRGNIEKNVFWSSSWTSEDTEPYKYCCTMSSYCNVYNINRPQDDCSLWTQPASAFMYGDPHLRTLDGYVYTFNGLGEFELLNIYSSTNNNEEIMKIQCRTRKISTGSATVFEAFAFKTSKTQVQIMTSLNAKNAVINENNEDLTQFQTSKNFNWRNNGVNIEQQVSEKEVYRITFDNGVAATITFDNSVLDIVLNVDLKPSSIYTNGLLGTFNGNKSDDFQLPDKSYISIDSNEETIYRNFGMLWATNTSIFQYENGRTAADYKHSNYIPIFWSSALATNATVNEFCQNRRTCIYDYLQTQNSALANSTRLTDDVIAVIDLLEAYPNPVINGSKDVSMLINETITLELNIDYDSKLNISLHVIKSSSSSIKMSNGKVLVNLTGSNTSDVSAAFYITSDLGHKTATFDLNVIVCPICVNGTCNATKEFNNPSRTSQYIPCTCNRGWKGDDCSIDYRCAPYECSPASTLEKCICECPDGYEYKDDKCVEINECTTQQPCEQTCQNTQGSYSCSCKPGFFKNGTNCTDIDECTLKTDCQQTCNNTEGSFTCGCYSGYTLNADLKTCNMTAANLNCNVCSNYQICTDEGGIVTCLCNKGYKKTSTGCSDIDECTETSGKCGNAICRNSVPGYTCGCEDGYTYDESEKTCKECPKAKWGPNCKNECNTMVCASCNKTTGCVCKPGMKGVNCSKDIDECSVSTTCNLNTTDCVNAIGSYSCPCKPGYSKISDATCEDIDECALQQHNCSANGICFNTVGSYRCTCNNGFTGDGFSCKDVDECASRNNNNCGHECNNTGGSYFCTCRSGYHIDDDRISCIYNGDDYCKTGNTNCSKDAKCSSSKENYTCTCNDGFEGDGFTCTDINECDRKEYKNCSIHAECVNIEGDYNCTCNTGWTGDGFDCTAVPEYFDEYLIYVIVGVIMGLLVWLCLMVCCVWCCCFGGYRRYRTHHDTLSSPIEYDPYNVHQGFGSLSSSFAGKGGGRYFFGKFLGTKYLRNWAEFSPEAGNEPIAGTSAQSIPHQPSDSDIRDSKWQRVLDRIQHTEVFHIDRPEISNRSYHT